MVSWLLDDASPGLKADPVTFLSSQELNQLAEKRFPKRRNEWLHGRWVAKQLLHLQHPLCKKLPLTEIIIQREASGAPFACLEDGTRLPGSLSITHSSSLAASALELEVGCKVGIDLEKIEPREPGIFKTFFTVAEISYIQSLPKEDLPEGVNLIWSAKEAVLKALGAGLSLDTRSIEISLPRHQKVDPFWGGWRKFEIKVCGSQELYTFDYDIANQNWTGWWKIYQGFILTLAISSPIIPSDHGLGGDIPFQVI
jgi:4'-phosphopantetheinyl transferase